MTIGAGQLHEADCGTRCIQRLRNRFGFGGRIKPVGIKAYDAKARPAALESICEMPAKLLGQIKIVDRARDVEIAVGIKPVGKAQALMAQIALDLEIGIEAEGFRFAPANDARISRSGLALTDK